MHFWPKNGVSFEYLHIVPYNLQAFYLRVLLLLNWLILVGVCGPFFGGSMLLGIFIVWWLFFESSEGMMMLTCFTSCSIVLFLVSKSIRSNMGRRRPGDKLTHLLIVLDWILVGRVAELFCYLDGLLCLKRMLCSIAFAPLDFIPWFPYI